MSEVQTYFDDLIALIRILPQDDVQKVIDLLDRARYDGRSVFLFGNGGSAATASHFACDLGKGTRVNGAPDFKVMALGDGLPTLTAYANDVGYEHVFAEPLAAWGQAGDIALGISASGNSPNVLRAMQVARDKKLATVGFIGFKGGKLKDLVDLSVIADSDHMGRIEDAHHIIQHAICSALVRRAQAHVQSGRSAFP